MSENLYHSITAFARSLGPVVRTVVIEERNDIVKSFDTTAEYRTDALPPWFDGLRFVLEDNGFTGMTIDIEDVHYVIRPKRGETLT